MLKACMQSLLTLERGEHDKKAGTIKIIFRRKLARVHHASHLRLPVSRSEAGGCTKNTSVTW